MTGLCFELINFELNRVAKAAASVGSWHQLFLMDGNLFSWQEWNSRRDCSQVELCIVLEIDDAVDGELIE